MASLDAPLPAPLGGDDPRAWYKTQQLAKTMPPLYDTRETSNLMAILAAIGESDNDIGGR